MLNNITLQARLGSDPEIRYTKTNTPVVSLDVACDRDRKNENGKRLTDWITIVAYKNRAELIHKFFRKGDMILIQGRLQPREYTDKNGNKRTACEVIVSGVNFCGSKKQGSDINELAQYENVQFTEETEADGDLPF